MNATKTVRCGNCKGTHGSAAEVKSCYGNSGKLAGAELPAPDFRRAAEANTAYGTRGTADTATEKQVNFIMKLSAERGVDHDRVKVAALTRRDASAVIDALLATQKVKATQPRNDELDLGAAHLQRGAVHVIGGEYIRVHIGQQSGRPYAVKAIITGHASRDEDGTLVSPGSVEWDRVPGLIFKLRPETMASAEEAAAFGELVGRCCFCSTPIDTPESTAAGYGPVCAGKYGLPWG